MFKKRVVFVTQDLIRLEECKNALKNANISFSIKVKGMLSTSRRARGSFGENPNYSKMYYLYVNKEDEPLAEACLNKQ